MVPFDHVVSDSLLADPAFVGAKYGDTWGCAC